MTEMPLEPTPTLLEASTREASTTATLEELRKRMPALCKRIPTLLLLRVHGVFSIVVTLAEFGIGKDLVSFVERSHLRFRAPLVRMSLLGSLSEGFLDGLGVCVPRYAEDLVVVFLFALFEEFVGALEAALDL